MSIYFNKLSIDTFSIMGGGAQDPGILNFNGLTYIEPSAMLCAYYDNKDIKAANFPDLSGIDEYGLWLGFDQCVNLTSFSMPKLTDINSRGM